MQWAPNIWAKVSQCGRKLGLHGKTCTQPGRRRAHSPRARPYERCDGNAARMLLPPAIQPVLHLTGGRTLCDVDCARLATVAILRDIGKAKAGFQVRLWREQVDRPCHWIVLACGHDPQGWALFGHCLHSANRLLAGIVPLAPAMAFGLACHARAETILYVWPAWAWCRFTLQMQSQKSGRCHMQHPL